MRARSAPGSPTKIHQVELCGGADLARVAGSVSQKIWLNLDRFRNCREFNSVSVWRISLAFANRPILHYGNGLRNIGGEAPPAQIKVPSAFGKYAPFSIKAPPAR